MKSVKDFLKSVIGRAVYAVVKRTKGRDTVIIYAGPLLGDALYSMAFIEEYKKANPRKKIVVWTSPKLFDTIATFHGYDKIKVIRSKVMRGLVWQIWNSDPRLHSRAVECGLLNQFAFRDLDPFASEMTLLKERIFQVSEAASISFHHVKPQMVTAIPDFYENKNKIVVLNPYSNTTHLSDGIMESFGRLAEYIKQRGGLSIRMLLRIKSRFAGPRNCVAALQSCWKSQTIFHSLYRCVAGCLILSCRQAPICSSCTAPKKSIFKHMEWRPGIAAG